MKRCAWAMKTPRLQQYHDDEWGVPQYTDQGLFEILGFEIFQAGLSLDLVLQRRLTLQKALVNFEIDQLAGFSEQQQRNFLTNPAVIRNQQKLEAVIHNARRWQAQQLHGFSPADQLWFLQQQCHAYVDRLSVSTEDLFTEQTWQLFDSWGLVRVGPATVQWFLRAAGFVNGHEANCDRFENQMIGPYH
ncbi:DNA-3-methyladenine glycosylase I [Furfurilactobacillus curtus]|uniref:DNA-3-methyladenine glycosylase I n=1 Tax=Furfurilactobacillus curtus TaxID=1746200 RepID=A0ABQ5JNA5_9LACO